MKPAPFAYFAPQDIDEALELLGQHGDEAKILAGGQSLMPLLNFRLTRARTLATERRNLEERRRREANRLRQALTTKTTANVFLDAGRFGSWPLVAPPGIPKEQMQSLRAAFGKTLVDPSFLDEANKKKLEVELISGEELQALAKEVIAQPPDVIERFQKLLGK